MSWLSSFSEQISVQTSTMQGNEMMVVVITGLQEDGSKHEKD